MQILHSFQIPYSLIRCGRVRNIPQKSSDLNHLRIAFAADLHLKGVTDKVIMDTVLAKIISLNPDLVLLGDDIIEGDRQDAEMHGHNHHGHD
jgi:predicted MPP superfamily phosphohydrolase